MKALMTDYKVLVEDSKQAACNVFIGEETLSKAKSELDEILKVKKMVVRNGTLEPQVETREEVHIDSINADVL